MIFSGVYQLLSSSPWHTWLCYDNIFGRFLDFFTCVFTFRNLHHLPGNKVTTYLNLLILMVFRKNPYFCQERLSTYLLQACEFQNFVLQSEVPNLRCLNSHHRQLPQRSTFKTYTLFILNSKN